MPDKGSLTQPPADAVDQREGQVMNELERMAVQNLAAVDDAQDVHVRDLHPNEDLQQGANNNWTNSNREWVQSGLSADTNNEVYSIDSNNRAENKIIGIYALANVASDPLTTEVRFLTGTGAPFERANVELFEVAEVADFVLLSQPVYFGADQDGSIEQWANAAGADKVVYRGKVAEQSGRTLEERRRGRNRR